MGVRKLRHKIRCFIPHDTARQQQIQNLKPRASLHFLICPSPGKTGTWEASGNPERVLTEPPPSVHLHLLSPLWTTRPCISRTPAPKSQVFPTCRALCSREPTSLPSAHRQIGDPVPRGEEESRDFSALLKEISGWSRLLVGISGNERKRKTGNQPKEKGETAAPGHILTPLGRLRWSCPSQYRTEKIRRK